MKGKRELSVGVHHISERGIVWWDKTCRDSAVLKVTCRAQSTHEKEFWHELVETKIDGFWSLIDAVNVGDEVTLVTVKQIGVPLGVWIEKAGKHDDRVEQLLEDTVGILAEVPAHLVGEHFSFDRHVLITESGTPVVAALPWFQLDSGWSRGELAEPADKSSEEHSGKQHGGQPPKAIWKARQEKSWELHQELSERVEAKRFGSAEGNDALVADIHRQQEPVVKRTLDDSMIDLEATTQIPLVRVARRRRGPHLVVSFLALILVAGLVWVRWQALPAETISAATDEVQSDIQSGSDHFVCPSSQQASESLENIMQVRAEAIESLDPDMLTGVEEGTILDKDVGLIDQLRREGWQLTNLAFAVTSATEPKCVEQDVTVEVEIGQETFEQCRAGECMSVRAQTPELLTVTLSSDLARITNVVR